MKYLHDNFYIVMRRKSRHSDFNQIIISDVEYFWQLPKPLLCGAANRAMLESEIWMSSGGTSSLLHAHADHDLHCVLAGRKDFILIEAKHKDNLQWIDKVSYILICFYIHPKLNKGTNFNVTAKWGCVLGKICDE